MRVVFVHGACVRDGSWWWHRTSELLIEQGVLSAAPPLPSCGETGRAPGTTGPGLPEDVAAVRQVLRSSAEPAVVVAHSYGGIVAAEAAAGLEAVQHLLLISSYLPEVGQSLSSFGDGEPAPFLAIDPDAGLFTARADLAEQTFLQDCEPDVVAEAIPRLTPQSLHVTEQSVGAAAWHQVPSTYVVCAHDRGTAPESQRAFARRAGTVVELDAGHHPFLSQPAAVRDLVLGLG